MEFDSRRRYYVYVWYIKDSQEVFYVGKGTGNRYLSKIRKDNIPFTEMIKNNDCESKIIKNHLTEKEAFELEKESIAFYRKQGNRLLNILDGGYEPPNLGGIPKSEEWKKKIRESQKRFFENHPEVRKIRSEKLKSFLETESGKEFQRKSLETRQTDDFRKAQSVRSRKANNTPEYIAKQSEIAKRMWESKEYADAHSGSNNCRAQAVKQYDLSGNFIREYETITLASIETGCCLSKISAVAKGKRKTTGGFIWVYSNDKKQTLKRKNNYRVENDKCAVPIQQFNLQGEFLNEYKSISEAARLNDLRNTTNIVCNLKGRTKSAYGYIWKYKHDNTVPSQKSSRS